MKHSNPRSSHSNSANSAYNVLPRGYPSEFTNSNLLHFHGAEVVGCHPRLCFHFAIHTMRMWGWNMYYIEVDNNFYFISYCENLGQVWSDCWKAKQLSLETMNLSDINQYAMDLFANSQGYKHNYIKFKKIL